jgi:hypothetical protein
MATSAVGVARERSNLWMVPIGIALLGAGLGALYICECIEDFWSVHRSLQATLRSLGSLLIASVTLGFVWQFFGKRAFLDEILAKAGIAKELTHAGILRVTDAFHHEVDWKGLFKNANRLDLFFAYAQTWRNTNGEELRRLASKKGSRIRVVLPDPDNAEVLRELARRFKYTPDHVKELIAEAVQYFTDLKTVADHNGAVVEIWLYQGTPQVSFYRFDDVGVLSLYTHQHQRTPLPTFIVGHGGTLYDFIRKEFDAMTDGSGLAKKIL